MSNKVLITNSQETVKIPSGIRLLIRRCCNAVLVIEQFPHPAEISVNFVDDAGIKEMNGEYRNNPTVTDVLSFPQFENGEYELDPDKQVVLLGDIVISVERAVAQAAEYNHTFQREMAYLTVHSMLHLLGYDHVNGGLEQVRMREREETVLTKLGLPRGFSYVNEE